MKPKKMIHPNAAELGRALDKGMTLERSRRLIKRERINPKVICALFALIAGKDVVYVVPDLEAARSRFDQIVGLMDKHADMIGDAEFKHNKPSLCMNVDDDGGGSVVFKVANRGRGHGRFGDWLILDGLDGDDPQLLEEFVPCVLYGEGRIVE